MKKITLALFYCALLIGAATVSNALTSNGYEYVKPRINEGLLSEDRGTIPYYWKFEISKEPVQGEIVDLIFSFSPTEDVENVGVNFLLNGVEVVNGGKDYYEKGFKIPGIIRKGEYKTYRLKIKFVGESVTLAASAGGNGTNYSRPSWLEVSAGLGDGRVIINTATKQYGTLKEYLAKQRKDPALWGNPTGYSAKDPWYGPENLRKDMETFKQATPGLSDIDARWLVDKAEYLSFRGKCDKRLDDNCGKIMAEIYKKNPFEDKRNPLFPQMRRAIINEMIQIFREEAKKKGSTLLDVLIIEANDWKKNRPEEKFILPPGPLDEGGSPINSIYPDKDTKASVTVSGRFVFQKHVVTKIEGITANTVAMPVRRALIWVWGNEPTPTYLGKTMTLDDGSFSINVTTTLNPPHLYAVIHMTGPTSVGLDAYMVKVLADTAYQYPSKPTVPFWRFVTPLLIGYTYPGIYDFGTNTLPVYSSSNTQPKSGAANIFDGIMRGCEYFYPGRVDATTMGKVKALWEPEFNRIPLTGYNQTGDTIYFNGKYLGGIGDPDEWNTCTIIHEFGHHVMRHCIDSIPDVAWTHAWEWEGFSRVGFNESWAHLVSASVLNDPIKTKGCKGINGKSVAYFNLENPWDFIYKNGAGQVPPYPSGKQGELCEATVTGALWDIYDHVNETHDTLNIGSTESAAFDTIFYVLRNFDPRPGNTVYNRCRTISDFQAGWTILYGLNCHKQALSDIYKKHKITFLYSSFAGINVTGRSLCCDVDWQLSSDTSGTKEFIVERSDYEYGPYAVVDTINYAIGETLYTKTDSAVQYNMPYWYRVAQVDSSDFIAYSEADSASPFDLAAPPSAPAPATGLTAIDRPSDQGRAINLSWTKSANDPGSVTKYYIYSSFNQNIGFSCIDSVPAGAEAFTDTATIDGDTLFYFVRAHNGVNGANSNIAFGVSFDNTPPAPPSGLSINIDSLLHVRLAWQKNTEPDLWGYRVYRSSISGSGYTLMTDPINLDTTYLDTTTINGQSYFYVITALDNASPSNESNYSTELSIHLPWLTTTPLATAYNNASKMVCDTTGANLHLVYQSNNKIWYSKSVDGGATWSADTALGEGQFPSIALDKDERPNVLYRDIDGHKIFYCRYDNGWSAPHQLLWLPDTTLYYPSLAIYKDGTAHFSLRFVKQISEFPPSPAFLYDGIFYGRFNVSTPNPTLTELTEIHGEEYYADHCWFGNPFALVDTVGIVNLIYNTPLFKMQLTRKDGIWADMVLDSINPYAEWPCLDINSNNDYFAAWAGSTDTTLTEIRYTHSVDGVIWDGTQNLSHTLGSSESPVLAGGGYCVWSDNTSGNWDIYYKRKIGNLWPDSTLKNISNTAASSKYPQACFSQTAGGSNLYVAWTEGDAAPYQIKFVKIDVPAVAKIYVDAGGATISAYCIQRDGYLVFGPESYQTIDYDTEQLKYRFDGFKKDKKYSIKLVYYCEYGAARQEAKGGPQKSWMQELDIDGTAKHRTKLVSGERITVEKNIPPAAYNKDGEIIVDINRISGDYAVCAEIFLYEFDKDYKDCNAGKASQLALSTPIGLPLTTAVYQNAPNPFGQMTNIKYQLAQPGKVSLKVYNIAGQLVKTLVNGNQTPGYYSANWDGKDTQGKKAANGVYFYRMTATNSNNSSGSAFGGQAGDYVNTRKMVVLK